MILLNDLKALWSECNNEALAAFDKVGKSGWWILGDSVKKFEKSFSGFVGTRYSVGCANGLDAIEIGLRTLGIRSGDKVLTTPLSAFATTLAIIKAGGVPIFVDTDDQGLIDLKKSREVLNANRDIRFMVPVHLYGNALNLQDLIKLRDDFSLLIIEDCAQSLGAEFNKLKCGSVGAMAATSFYPTKNLGAMGDGGCLYSSHEGYEAIARALRDYGQTEKYQHTYLGLNSRLDEVQAAMLDAAFLPRLSKWTSRRRAIARHYLDGIKNSFVRPLHKTSLDHSVWHLFPLFVESSRDEFMAYLRKAGIQTAIHYPNLITEQKAMSGVSFEIKDDLRISTHLCRHEVSIPIHPYLSDSEVDKIIDVVNSWKL